MNDVVLSKIKELDLLKEESYISWAYTGETYCSKQGDLYCVINDKDNEELELSLKGDHLYKIRTEDEIEGEVNLIFVV
jgi:hypothetical protein